MRGQLASVRPADVGAADGLNDRFSIGPGLVQCLGEDLGWLGAGDAIFAVEDKEQDGSGAQLRGFLYRICSHRSRFPLEVSSRVLRHLS